MQRAWNAQRRHIIHSLDNLLYQFHALSFFLSPSCWSLLCRMLAQSVLAKPRDVDPSRSLRFWFIFVTFVNASAVWTHATQGAIEGRTIILDFVGSGAKPPRIRLLFLDLLIVIFQWMLVAIAYESAILPSASNSSSDNPSLPHSSSTINPSNESPWKALSPDPESNESYIVDLHFSTIWRLLRESPHRSEELLPLPNTTGWPLPSSLRLFLRARAEMRRRTRMERHHGNEGTNRDTPGAVPGGMESDGT